MIDPRRRQLLQLAAAAPLVAVAGAWPQPACAAFPKPERPLKIGYVYVGPIGDAGWTWQHDLGRKAVEASFGEQVQVKVVESVSEATDAERVIRELAASGHGLVFATSFGYMNPTLRVAKQFPKVIFEHATGYRQATNVGVYAARHYEARYLTGIVAGRMSKSGIAGYVAAFPIPEVVMGINAFLLGMKSVNPQAQARVIWVNAWSDPGREREAAATLVTQGADVLTHHTDSTAVVQAAADKGVYALGYHSDMSKYGPKAHLCAATHHWEAYYQRVVQQVLDGSWVSDNVWSGLKDGMVAVSPLNPVVPADVGALLATRRQEIIDGRLLPFQGPLFDQNGRQVIGAGAKLADDELLKMNYYVEGVVGQLPK